MRARSFSIGLVVAAAAMAVATMLANVLLDPQGVFGTPLVKAHFNANLRYVNLRNYRADAARVDALIFGSSRGFHFNTDLATKAMGVERAMNMSVPAGLLTDYLPMLQYVLTDKAATGRKPIKAILLLLDMDFFGRAPWTDKNLDAFLPPGIEGVSAAHFWLRYLMAVQFKNWRHEIKTWRELAGSADAAGVVADTPVALRPVMAAMLAPPSLRATPARSDARDGARPIRVADQPAPATTRAEKEAAFNRWRNAHPPDLARQIDLLMRFVGLCRDNGITLTVAINPLTRRNAAGYQPGQLDALAARINRMVPLWDFAAPAWLDDARYWQDESHFTDEVGTMMINRMFSTGADVPADFGRYRPLAAN